MSQLTGDGYHVSSYLPDIPHKRWSLSSHPCHVTRTTHLSCHSSPRNDHKGPHKEAPRSALLAFSGHAGQREWAPEAGLVRAGWEAVGAAHKAERAGIKMWVLDSALQGVPQGISLSEPTA